MFRTLYAIKCTEGLLVDFDTYTQDPCEALVFADFDVAAKRIASLKNFIGTGCRITAVQLPFPRPKAIG